MATPRGDPAPDPRSAPLPGVGATTSGSRRPVLAPTAQNRARYRRILRFAAGVLVQMWWFELVVPRLGLSRLAERGRTRRLQRFARRFHGLAVQLGGLMIKVGQFLSSRLDVLPPEITKELEGLQDEVPAVPFDGIRTVAEPELGMPLPRAFAGFEPVPVAAASLGQAHRATLTHDDAARDRHDRSRALRGTDVDADADRGAHQR